MRAILRDPGKGAPLRELGCEVAVADVQDAAALAAAIADAAARTMMQVGQVTGDDRRSNARSAGPSLRS